jgi:hypothetical protein
MGCRGRRVRQEIVQHGREFGNGRLRFAIVRVCVPENAGKEKQAERE